MSSRSRRQAHSWCPQHRRAYRSINLDVYACYTGGIIGLAGFIIGVSGVIPAYSPHFTLTGVLLVLVFFIGLDSMTPRMIAYTNSRDACSSCNCEVQPHESTIDR